MASRLIRNQLPVRVAGSSPVSSAARIDPPKHGSIFLRLGAKEGEDGQICKMDNKSDD